MEAVPEAVGALYGVDAAFRNGSLLPHLLFWVRGRLQCLEDAHADPWHLNPLASIAVGAVHVDICVRVGGGRRRALEVGHCQGDDGVGHGLICIRRAAILLLDPVRGVVAGGCMLQRWLVLVLLVLDLVLLLGVRLGRVYWDEKDGAYPESQLTIRVLGLVGRAGQVFA
jgi:hypothetical protein